MCRPLKRPKYLNSINIWSGAPVHLKPEDFFLLLRVKAFIPLPLSLLCTDVLSVIVIVFLGDGCKSVWQRVYDIDVSFTWGLWTFECSCCSLNPSDSTIFVLHMGGSLLLQTLLNGHCFFLLSFSIFCLINTWYTYWPFFEAGIMVIKALCKWNW